MQTQTGFNFHPTKQGTESLDPFPQVEFLSQMQPVSCYRAKLPSPGKSITGWLHHCHKGLQELGKSTGLSVLLLTSSGIHCHRNLLSPCTLLSPCSSPDFPRGMFLILCAFHTHRMLSPLSYFTSFPIFTALMGRCHRHRAALPDSQWCQSRSPLRREHCFSQELPNHHHMLWDPSRTKSGRIDASWDPAGLSDINSVS